MPIAEELYVQVDAALSGGRIAEARTWLPSLRAESTDPRALTLIGRLQAQDGDHAGALALLDESIKLAPESSVGYRSRAEIYRLAGQHAAAARDLGVALKLHPQDDDLIQAYAESALQANIFDEAAATLAEFLEQEPNNAFCVNLVGAMLQLAERAQEATPFHRRAVELNPLSADYANNLGTSLRRLGHFEESEEYLARAVRLDQNHYMAWYNLGNIYRSTRRLQLAETAYRRSIALFNTFPESHFTLACVLLQTDRWIEGWHEFEWRWQSPRIVAPITIDLPIWDGENPAGKRILVVTEQGSGDTLQFARYTRLLAERGAEVTIWAPKETAGLLRRLPHITAAATFRSEMPAAEVYIPMMSLPRVLESSPEDIPPAPYLQYDHARALDFAAKLGPRRERLRIGIAWAGNPKQGDDHFRSAKLSDFAGLFDLSDIRWIGIQKGARAADIAELGYPIEDWSDQLDSFDTTAALFANLDGVVCVCTGPVHLAGALGLQTACLLSWTGDWRWGLHEHETPWYPSMTLIRSPRQNDWQSVTEQTKLLIAQWQPQTLVDRQPSGVVSYV